jgi:hypothetical protein
LTLSDPPKSLVEDFIDLGVLLTAWIGLIDAESLLRYWLY